MSKVIKSQLVEIRKQAARIELEKMRAHLKAKKAKLATLQREEKDWTKVRRLERRSRLKELKSTIRAAVSSKGRTAERKRRLLAIAEQRRAFTVWWEQVRRERIARLDEIKRLRRDLLDWSKQGPARRREAIAQITAEAQRQLAAFDEETARGLDILGEAVHKARRELKSDEYDLRVWTSNRARDAKLPPMSQRERKLERYPFRKNRKELALELDSNVEANLETPEEWAWWRRNKSSILRNAKVLGKTEGDEIAEMIREAVGDNPEEALGYLADDADAWVEAEIRRQGFAA
jgi:hypothetical protein